MSDPQTFMSAPDERGHFGNFGGRFVPEALMPACFELEAAFIEAWNDVAFTDEYHQVLREFGGRPTPITPLTRLSEQLGIRLFAKREDLAHTGSHKINNVVGQTLLTKRMGKKRVIAETGAGQHGVATATAAARLGLECTVYMGEVDTERQALNVFRMELLGATVVPVTSGSRCLLYTSLAYVDIFYHHRPDPETPMEESMGALDTAVRSGRALYAGISAYNAEQTSKAVKILRNLGTPCLIHQPKYSMFVRSPEQGLFDVLEKEGVGSIVFSPLAQGLLSDRYLNGIPSDSRAARDFSLKKKEMCIRDSPCTLWFMPSANA